MAIISINEAARKTGAARSTIQRAIKNGRLSLTTQPDGTKGIDTSELFRVFGDKPRDTPQDPPALRDETAAAALKSELDMLRSQLDSMRRELDTSRGREHWYQERIEALERRLPPPARSEAREKPWRERLRELFKG